MLGENFEALFEGLEVGGGRPSRPAASINPGRGRSPSDAVG
jgi:hypothetical protein